MKRFLFALILLACPASAQNFDEVYQKLKQGRTYTAQKTGVIMMTNRTADGIDHTYAVNIPASYDTAKRYQVRFQLHGGVGRTNNSQPRGNGEIGPLASSVEQIYVLPYAWADAPWWDDDQILNLNAILEKLKETYNIDENRVVISGVSDGATGAYYIAMRDTTPWASFLPLNGFVMVLSSPDIEDGHIFPNNLRNKPLFVVNGGIDRLYPIRRTEPFTRHFMENGVEIDYHPEEAGEHNTAWWPQMKVPFEKFVAEHPRDPHPARLTWEAADQKHNRAHWLVIDEFGRASGEPRELEDLNLMRPPGSPLMSLVVNQLFEKAKGSGRVDLVRSGNAVEAVTKGVTAFTLLLSPDVFDFNQPIKVIANGKEVFNARVDHSVQTLEKWAKRDNDRTMLYAAEISIKLPK